MAGDDLRHHPVHAIAPTGAPYVLKLWHKDRASLQGYMLEARVFLKAMLSGPGSRHRFLIVGRPRSGSTLLGDLLNQTGCIECHGEMLHHAVLAPRALLRNLARKTPRPGCAVKLLTYQMLEVQRLRDPEAFLRGLTDEGVRLIHLRRRSFDQSLSLSLAQEAGLYHLRKEAGPEGASRPVTLDPQAFLHQLRWNLAMLDYEDRLLARFDHLRIDYEEGLSDAARHQETIGRICGLIGLTSAPVAARLGRVGARYEVTNMEALREAIAAAGLGAVLTERVAG